MEEGPIRNRRRVSFVQEKVNTKGTEDTSISMMEAIFQRLAFAFSLLTYY